MPIYCDPDEIIEYVMKSDRELPAADQPKMLIGLPTASDQDAIAALFGQIDNEIREGESEQARNVRIAQQMTGLGIVSFVLKTSLRGWTNWKKPDGSPVEFQASESGQPTDRCLSMFRHQIERIELMNAILGIIGLTVTDQD